MITFIQNDIKDFKTFYMMINSFDKLLLIVTLTWEPSFAWNQSFAQGVYELLAEGLGVVREKNWRKKFEKKIRIFSTYNTPGHPWVSTKNFSPIGPAVWPAVRNIYMNVLFMIAHTNRDWIFVSFLFSYYFFSCLVFCRNYKIF